jgi:hypothetical protein
MTRFQRVGDGLMSPGMVKVPERDPQHPLLHEEYRPENLHAVAPAHFLVAFGRLQDFPPPLISIAHIIGQAQKRPAFLTDQRRAFIDVMNGSSVSEW